MRASDACCFISPESPHYDWSDRRTPSSASGPDGLWAALSTRHPEPRASTALPYATALACSAQCSARHPPAKRTARRTVPMRYMAAPQASHRHNRTAQYRPTRPAHHMDMDPHRHPHCRTRVPHWDAGATSSRALALWFRSRSTDHTAPQTRECCRAVEIYVTRTITIGVWTTHRMRHGWTMDSTVL